MTGELGRYDWWEKRLILRNCKYERIEEEFNKRPPVVVLSQEEYERRQAEGTIEKGTIYATTEDSND